MRSQPLTAVLIGGPRDLTKMVIHEPLPEIRVYLAAPMRAFDVQERYDVLTVSIKHREAIYRRTITVDPVHGQTTMIYVYDGERD